MSFAPIKKAVFLFLFCLAPNFNLLAENLEISLIAASSVSDSLPSEIFHGIPFKPEPGAEFVKIHLHFNRSVEISRIAVQFCEGPILNPISTYINFDEASVSLRPEKSNPKNTLESKKRKFSAVRSVTVNFGANRDICVKDIRFYDKDEKPYKIIPDLLVPGSVSASSTLAPATSYAATNLFDSRYEYAWASQGESGNTKLDFNFKNDVTIEAIKFWNGYQRSDVHCYSNSRLRVVRVSGDGDFKETLKVQDVMGSQTLKLKQKFLGKNITLEILSVWRGKQYKDIALSEIRFFDGKNWFMPDPSESLKSVSRKNRADFHAAGLDYVINKSIANKNWTFRFRSDGSFYATGTKMIEGSTNSFYALGNYEVKAIEPEGISLRIFGVLREKSEESEGDCNGCGRNCNQESAMDDGPNKDKESIFQDFIRIEKSGNDLADIRNTGKRRRLQFGVLKKLRKSSDL